jgi:hypothetical protein
MVIVRLMGGLGNQMFQYAMGRALAHARQAPVKVDFELLKADAKRTYALDGWNVSAPVATLFEVLRIRAANKLSWKLKPSAPFYVRPVLREQTFLFDPDALRAPQRCLLIGYWQSEKYFKNIEATIRQEFTLRIAPGDKTQEVARAIQSCNSVCVHVRRGDFISEPHTQQAHGTCSLEYYRQAAEYIAQRIPDLRFFVFSDNAQWVRENLALGVPITVIDHNPPGDGHAPGREHEDMWLMSLCKHAVLANSSFSWWGAWLNPVRDRIVVAPRQWFGSLGHETRDLIPEHWTRM